MARIRPVRPALLASAVALVIIAAGCSSSDDTAETADQEPTETAPAEESAATTPEAVDEPDETPEQATGEPTEQATEGPTDEPAELTASWQGVTPEEIRVGVTVIDTDQLADLFDVHVDLAPSGLLGGLAATKNAEGGINGRQLEMFIDTFLPVGTGPAEEVCTRFAEDEEVFIVTGQALGDTMLCYTETYEIPYLGYFGLTPEREERSIAPFMAVEMASDLQRGHATDILISDGYLDGNAVGVYWSAGDEPLAKDAVIPRLEEAGIEIASTASLPDFGGDQLATDDAIDVIIERFKADGVDAIINISEVVTLSQGLDRVDYRPELYYLNGQVNNADIFEGSGIDPATLTGAVGVSPSNLTPDELLADELFLQCVEDYNTSDPEEPIDLGGTDDEILGSVSQNCAGFHLLVMLLEAAGPDLTPDTLAAAADSLGTFDLPGQPGASMAPGKWSAGNAMRIYEYDPDTFQFHAAGDPIIVTS